MTTTLMPTCHQCGVEIPGVNGYRKWCSSRCKHRWRKSAGLMPTGPKILVHNCRVCGVAIPLGPGHGNKWLCSVECIRAQTAKIVRTFPSRRPAVQAAYRQRTRTKIGPDSQHRRFYLLNPAAPHACESCGETRVLEIAHRPEHARHGARRSSANMKWPEMVWVLCPTCHRLLDRMHYSLADLGLT